MTAKKELRFVENGAEGLAAACVELARSGHRRILLRPGGEAARGLIERVRAKDAEAAREIVWLDSSAGEFDAVAVHHEDADAVSDVLLDYLDLGSGTVVAPVTARYFRNLPLFLISIPKAGTHLLYRLAETLGYDPAVIATRALKPGCWYCLEYSNSHTSARDFFIDTVRRSPFGNRDHAFPRTPALFIYRHPLDILVAEAEYNHREGKTLHWGYLAGRDFEERLLTLIDDPWLFGPCRDRIGAFLPWCEFPNVIPVSFEELVGHRGGASDEVQERVIWSIMLKLHAPGDPAAVGARLFDTRSPTFREGRIGAHRERFTPRAWERLRAIPQDFIEAFGYDLSTGAGPYPRRAESFRRRPLRLGREDLAEEAFLIHSNDAARTNIEKRRGRYYVIPWGERWGEGATSSFSFPTYQQARWFLPVMLLPLRHVQRLSRIYQRFRRLLG